MTITTSGGDTYRYTWRIEAGEREKLSIPLFDGDGEPADVTGWTADVAIKTEPGGGLLYQFPAEHITITGSTIELLIPAPVSAAWFWSVGWWRVLLTAPDPNPLDPNTQRIVAGTFLVDRA